MYAEEVAAVHRVNVSRMTKRTIRKNSPRKKPPYNAEAFSNFKYGSMVGSMTHELTQEEILEVLATQVLGHIACCEDDKPYVVPMAFSYKNGILYGQTTEGRKTEMLRRNPNCCFHVGDTKGGTWRSVVCEGIFEELDFESLKDKESIDAVKLLSDRLSTVQDVVGIDVPINLNGMPKPLEINGKKATLFRIVITDLSGKGGKSS